MSLSRYFFERITADVRQQMDGVLALAEQLSRQPLTPDAQACLAGVVEAAGGVRRTLDGVVDMRALGSEQIVMDASPLRLRDLMDDIQDRWQPRATQNGVTLLVSYDGDPDGCVLADRVRLAQVFDGFLGESIAAARRGAVEVSLKAATTPAGVALYGRVRGARASSWESLDLEARVRQVDAQFGLDVALGIVLARRILDDLKAVLHTEVNPGAAETIAFDLVLQPASDQPEPVKQSTERAAHVLVVDDNATNRMVAQALVEMFDCTCECVVDGIEAVEAAASGRFDLVLMDIKMPRMDGVSAARAIRGLAGDVSRVPIIALTANADPEDAQAYLAAGMNGVVEKPMKPEHLFEALRAALAPPPAAGTATDAAAAA